MARFSVLLAIILLVACNDKKEGGEEDPNVFNYSSFSQRFKEVTTPYALADTALLNNKDTASIRNTAFLAFIADSVKQKLFGKKAKVKFIPLVRLEEKDKEKYYVIKATSGNRKAAILVTFDKDNNYGAAIPFLIPDANPKTSQVSSIDKAFSISKAVFQRNKDDVMTEGKNVYIYNAASKDFTLIMTDMLDDSQAELINPIDTFSKKNPWTGDYVKDKQNLVSVRDGRNEKEINFFIHFNKNKGECTGELKGTALFTSSKTAVYRQGGDPCVLELHFAGSSVTLKEVEGCGSHRGMKCLFEGSFPKKREPKSGTKKSVKN